MKKAIVLFSIATVICLSCSKDNSNKQELEVRTAEISFHSGEIQAIDAISDFDISYRSANEFHAKVTNQGYVQAVKVGATSIEVSSNGKTVNVDTEVIPVYETYPTPIVDWNTYRSEIIASQGQPDFSDSISIGYDGYSTKAPAVLYQFDENEKLIASSVIVESIYLSELNSFIEERYLYFGEQDGIIISINTLDPNTASIIVGHTELDDQYWTVIYIPNTSKQTPIIHSLSEEFSKTMKLFVQYPK
jgi:hypothetical protein